MPNDIDVMDLDRFVEGSDTAMFSRLRREEPLHWNSEPDGPGFWSLTRYGDIKAAASNAETFSSADGTQIHSRRAEGEGRASIQRW